MVFWSAVTACLCVSARRPGVTARHAKGRFDVANIDMVDVLHIVSSE